MGRVPHGSEHITDHGHRMETGKAVLGGQGIRKIGRADKISHQCSGIGKWCEVRNALFFQREKSQFGF